MSTRTKLAAKLAPVTRKVLAQFGVSALFYVPVSGLAADNSTTISWQAASGIPTPCPVLPDLMTDQRRHQVWGQETKADLTGYVAMQYPVLPAMVLAFQGGPFAGRYFEITKDIPDDLGGVRTLALVEVKARPVLP